MDNPLAAHALDMNSETLATQASDPTPLVLSLKLSLRLRSELRTPVYELYLVSVISLPVENLLFASERRCARPNAVLANIWDCFGEKFPLFADNLCVFCFNLNPYVEKFMFFHIEFYFCVYLFGFYASVIFPSV